MLIVSESSWWFRGIVREILNHFNIHWKTFHRIDKTTRIIHAFTLYVSLISADKPLIAFTSVP
jgi:hypothetical protein